VDDPISQKLRVRGLDISFLRWLEGKEDRLPRLHAVNQLEGEDLAAAIRAAAWLRQLCFQRDIVVPSSMEDWDSRYKLLEDFLCATLLWSMTGSTLHLNEELETLEHVLDALLPQNSWSQYRTDFRYLRKKGQPPRFPNYVGRPSGGKKQSEETDRIRAAIAYVATVSKTPYADLAAFWNGCLKTGKYDAASLKSRLRKGNSLNRTLGAGERLLEHWKAIYALDLKRVYPSPFPPSRELEVLWHEKQEKKGP
jgi:hypothetical protein